MDRPVAVDAMGGDLGCEVAVEGAIQAFNEFGIHSIIVGDEAQIKPILQNKFNYKGSEIVVHHADEVITMHDSPAQAVRKKPRSSIRLAYELVKEKKASAVVSPGNTGAVMATGLYVLGALPGILRPAIATLLPKVGDALPTVFLDAGANVECDAAHLVQFALMGNYYAQVALKKERPRIALLSNGSESSKGTDTIRSAAVVLGQLKELNFIGYVEGRDLPRDIADVVVCDGFVGNVVLKAMEGSVELVVDSMRNYVGDSVRGKVGLWLAKPLLKSLFRDKLDPSSYGGAPLLGLSDLAIICHGSSNGRAIKNAMRVAQDFVREKLLERIEQSLVSLEEGVSEDPIHDGVWARMGMRFEKKKRRDNV